MRRGQKGGGDEVRGSRGEEVGCRIKMGWKFYSITALSLVDAWANSSTDSFSSCFSFLSFPPSPFFPLHPLPPPLIHSKLHLLSPTLSFSSSLYKNHPTNLFPPFPPPQAPATTKSTSPPAPPPPSGSQTSPQPSTTPPPTPPSSSSSAPSAPSTRPSPPFAATNGAATPRPRSATTRRGKC